MHIEFLIEDSSGKKLLDILLPKFLGEHSNPHTWNIHGYKGIGHIPPGLTSKSDPAKRVLLEQLPKLLRGYGNTPGVDAVVVIVDADKRDCAAFLAELKRVAADCTPAPNTLFRLAIEEIEAWYLGDRNALQKAYPKAKQGVFKNYVQDSACGTWELLADAVHPGGYKQIKQTSWPTSGVLKHEWAEKIGTFIDVEKNVSPSFNKLRDGLFRLIKKSG
ncbi:MAG: DUF4276 family protein [Betaproteobacteria bacterium]|nr:DUF4276 family protein [Betaproteobacteria bacterium]